MTVQKAPGKFSKYSFLIISDDNLQLLQLNKNLKEYKDLLNKQYPGKF